METKAFQDYYPDDLAHCYGCGKLNPHGYHLKSYREGTETVARFKPEPYHIAVPGYVYGGLIASLIDCHSTGTASAAKYRAENRELGSEPPLRFLTASLHVNYLKPTPIDTELMLRATVKEVKGRKVVVEVRLYAEDDLCATGEVVTVQMPEGMPLGKPADQEG
ncbi:MAG: PaaI family thioesterase [Chlorobi bacterium]|nr:PaaI family thioesterase [Chlorobiota bacterium]